MATTTKNLYRANAPAVAGSPSYTVPSSTTTIITNVIVCNTDTVSRTFTIAIYNTGLANGTNLFNQATIAAKTTTIIDLKQVLTAAQELYVTADAALVVSVSINGLEIA